MEVTFEDLEEEFNRRVSTMVWCNVATLDRQGRIRSRILHPIWEDATGWIATRRTSHKAAHLAHHPYVSLAYVADVAKPVYADCIAEWDDLPEARQHVWDLFLSTPPPLGYDPAPLFKAPDDPGYGVLKLTPWRIELAQFPQPPQVWHNPAVAAP